MKGSNGAFSFAMRLGIVLALAIGLAVPAGAQVTFGVLTGTVTDPTGAVILGAEVTVTHLGTNLTQTVTTSSSGVYRAGQLSVGQYKIEVVSTGFKTALKSDVTVNVGAITRQDFQLEVGSATEVITVEAGAVMVNTEDSRLTSQIVGKQIQELPLNGRNLYNLIQLAPGAVNVLGVTDGENGENTSVNGMRQNFNGFLINGVSNKRLSGGANTLPNPDLVAEFQMLTLNMSAQYGNSAASITNLVTKSGTNDFHGSVFYFFRNDKLDATEFFRNQAGAGKPPLRFNQFGGVTTGPIIKDKLFFTASYQGTRFSAEAPAETLQQETAAWRQAIASALPNSTAAFLYQFAPNGAAVPGSTVTLSDFITGGSANFGSFADYLCTSTLDPDGLDPVTAAATAAQFQTLFGVLATDDFSSCLSGAPAVTGPGLISRTIPFMEDSILVLGTQGRVGESGIANLFNGDEWSTRLDFVTDKDRIFGEVYWQLVDDRFGPSNVNQAGGRGFLNPAETFQPNFQASWVRTISPTMINEFRLGVSRTRDEIDVALPGVPDVQFLDGTMGIGSYNGYPQFFNETIYSYSDLVSVTKGSHNLKMGVDFRRNIENSEFNVARPSYYFLDTLFFAVDLPAEQVSGVDPGIISGQPAQLATNNRAWSNWEVGVFIQDDWKVTRNLTLNLGLRYDLFMRHSEKFNRETTFILGPGGSLAEQMLSASIPTGSPGCSTATGQDENLAQILGECGPGGFTTADELGKGDLNNFGPRFGVAWDPRGDGKTAIRGGVGISYEGTLYNPLSNSRWNLPFYSFNFADNFLFGDTANIVYGAPTGQTPRFDGDPTNIGQGVGAQATGNLSGWDASNANVAFLTGIVFPEGIKDPWVFNYHIGVQHEFLPDTVLEVNYVGTRGNKLFRAENINRLRGVRLPNGVTLTDNNGEQISNPGQLGPRTRLNPNFGTMRVWQNVSKSWYDSLQVTVRKAMSHGFMFNVNYTWSHSLDTGSTWHSGFTTSNGPVGGEGYTTDVENPNLDKGNSLFDVRHRIALNYVWELPSGNQQGAVGKILNGWQWNGIVTAQSGVHFSRSSRAFSSECTTLGFTDPLCVNTGGDFNLDGERNDRPDVGTGGTTFNPTTDQWANGWFSAPPLSTGFFATPCLGCNGNLGRNTFEGPGQFQVDMSLFKNTPISEQASLQFRFEVFNLFNRTNFLMPSFLAGGGNLITTSNFGKAQGTLTPRAIQFGLKILW